MQKVFAYIGGALLTITLLFGGGFLTGRLTANKQSSDSGSDDSNQISRIVELTRSYLIERSGELKQREDLLAAREVRIADRERIFREAEERARADRADVAELEGVLTEIIRLSTAR